MARVTLISQAEYARHRGCSQEAVRKALATGRITGIEQGGAVLVDPAVADIQWAANSRPRAKTVRAEQGPTAPAIERTPGEYDRGEAAARREHHEAVRAELKAGRESAALVERKRARRGAADVTATLRLRLEQLPSKLGSRLAAETDPAACRALLAAEIRQALAEAAADLRALTSRADALAQLPPT